MRAFFSASTPEELEAARASCRARRLPALTRASLGRRREGWTMLRLPTPALHPGLAEAAARRLGLARDAILQLARCEAERATPQSDPAPVPDAQQRAEENSRRLARLDDETRARVLRERPNAPFTDPRAFVQPPPLTRCGPQALARWLGRDGADFLVDAVPIPPSDATPPRPGVDGRLVTAPAERALRELIWSARAIESRGATEDVELDADAIAQLQRALEACCEALASRAAPTTTSAIARRGRAEEPPLLERPDGWSREDRGAGPDHELPPILACVWARDRVVVQRRHELVWIYPDGETEQLRFEGAVIGWIDPRAGLCVAATRAGLGIYDLGEGRWLDQFPAHAPRWLFWEGTGGAYLRDERGRTRPLLELTRDAAVIETTPDASLLWVEDLDRAGGVYDTRDGALVGAPPSAVDWLDEAHAMLRPSGALLRAPTFADDEPERVAERWDEAIAALDLAPRPASALVLRADATLWFLREGVLFKGSCAQYQLGWPSLAAAFDRAGERLALVDADQVLIVDPEAASIERRVTLPPPRFTGSRASSPAR